MDAEGATLSVGFVIDPDFTELERAQTMMNSTEAKVLASAKQVEQATSGMINLGGATAKLSTFANATTQAGATAEAAFSRATKSGEAMSRQLQYQIDTFGMSRAAARAYFAELAGNTELAERLRAQEASLVLLREKSTTGLHDQTGAVGQARIGQMELMHVVRGMSDQIAAGASPIQALSMHMSMLGQAASLSGSSMGKFGTYMSGVWGIAIMAGLAVLTPLVAKLFEGNNALDEGVDKLKKSAAQTDIDRHAKDIYAHSEEGVVEAIRARIAAQDDEINKSRTQGEQDNLLAQSAMKVEEATRKQTQALLEQAIAQQQINRINTQRPGEKGDLAAMQSAIADARVAGLQQLLQANAAAMKQAGVEFQRSLIELAQESAKRAADPLEAIKRKYDDQAKAAVAAAKATIAAGGHITTALTVELAAIERNKNAAIKAEQDRQRELKNTENQIGRNITLEEGRRIAQSVGGRVTSDHRDTAKQQQLYDKYQAYKAGTGPWAALAAKPGSSYHEMDQAVDVAKSDGVTLKKLVGAYRAAGVSLVEALDEGNHYHIAWKKVGDAAKQQSAEVTAAAREATAAAAGEAQIANLYRLADAYKASGGAALIAQAQLDAESSAIRRNGDIQAAVDRQVRIAIAERVANAVKDTAALREQTAAQAKVNAAVEAGLVPASKAAQMVQDQIADLPLLAAIEAAQQRGLATEVKKATDALNDQRRARADNRAEQIKAQFNSDISSGNNQLAMLQAELGLVGATDAVRTHILATVRATQDAIAKGYTGDQLASYIAQQVAIADQAQVLTNAQDNYNRSLSYTADLLGLINDQAHLTASGLSDAFGKVGAGIGETLTALTNYHATQARLDQEHKAAVDAVGKGTARAAQLDILYAKQSSIARQQAVMQAIGGIKSLFKEHSTAYKVMSAIEKAYAAWKAAQAILEMARDIRQTISSIANSGARATAAGAEGIAHQSKLPFPYNIAAMAATAVALIAAGVAVFGGGGGGASGPTIPTSDDLQKAAGTGTVLGSPKDQSASIAHSLDLVAKNTNEDLQYSNQMLVALRSIDTSIGAMAASVAKQINVNGSLFDTTGLKLGETGSSGFLGLFASSKTRTLFDAGITLAATTVGDIVASGIAGSTYQVVEQIKKSSGFLGIGGGTKTTYSTTTGALPSDITGAIQSVIGALESGLVAAAKIVGIDGAKALIDGFQVDLGKISFNGLDAKGIEDELNAIFSSVGDKMAQALFPALASMQKVGEGLFETFVRVAKEYETVDVEMQSLGRGFGAVGLGSIAARDALVQLFGGLDQFVSATDAFRSKFLTDAEQMVPIQAAVIAQLKLLGLSSVTTREQFKNVVLGLDLTTDAGRQMYASLLAMAPAFDKVASYFESANKTLTDSLQSTVDKFKGFVDSLTKYRATLFDTTAAQDAAYAILRKRFTDTAALAATGDATALGGLQDSAKSFLDSSLNNAKTMLDYQRDVATVARGVDQGIFAAESTADYAQLQLDAMKNANGILQQISVNTAATTAALTQPVVTTTSTTSTPVVTGPDAPATQADIQALSDSINSGLETIAEYTGTTATVLRTASRGDYLNIGNDPDSGLTVLP